MGNGGEKFVADRVAMTVVDGLEVVEIETNDGQYGSTAVGLHDGVLQAIAKEHAIGQAGEQVVPGNPLEFPLVLLIRGDVREEGDILLRFTRSVAYGSDGEHLGEDAAIFGAIPDFAGPMAAFDEVTPHVGVELFALST